MINFFFGKQKKRVRKGGCQNDICLGHRMSRGMSLFEFGFFLRFSIFTGKHAFSPVIYVSASLVTFLDLSLMQFLLENLWRWDRIEM